MIDKINTLGGILSNPICSDEESVVINFDKVEELIEKELPIDLKKFHQTFGACSFKKSIVFESKKTLPKDLGEISVNNFYSLNIDSKCSFASIGQNSIDLIDRGYLPICDGYPGDLICLSLTRDTYGAIYYWSHDAYEDDSLHPIADNFEEFILNLKEEEEKKSESVDLDKINVTMSDKMRAMLAKSGVNSKK